MEKKTYVQPETEAIHMESCRLLAESDRDSIKKAESQDDIKSDKDGYYWAD